MPGKTETDVADRDLEIIRTEFPKELENALGVAKKLADQMPKDFNWTEEPAHIFSASLRRSNKT